MCNGDLGAKALGWFLASVALCFLLISIATLAYGGNWTWVIVALVCICDLWITRETWCPYYWH